MTTFTTPRTWTIGELVSKEIMDTHIRDNLNAIWVGTSSGDMDYYTSSSEKARLPKGLVNQILSMKSDGSFPEWNSIVKYRKGGSATDFQVAGTTTYNPSNVFIQMGTDTVDCTTNATTSYHGFKYVTFPVAFSDKPIVFAVSQSVYYGEVSIFASSASTTQFGIGAWSPNSLSSITVAWFAIGPT